MSQLLVFILMLLALVLPVLGAVALRLFIPRLSPAQFYGAAALIFGVAFVSVIALARSNISSLQIGGLSLLLPVSAPDNSDLTLPPPVESPSPLGPTATGVAPTATDLPATAPVATAVLAETSSPTVEPPTPEPPTPEPPTPEPPPQTEPRAYTVQEGDTLRGIAEQFGVSVQSIIDANNLSPEEADALQVGQELVIP